MPKKYGVKKFDSMNIFNIHEGLARSSRGIEGHT